MSPEDWFDVFDFMEVREKWEEGMSAEEIVGELYLGDGTVDYQEILEWIERLIQQWQAA
jgi:hypothetical protein